MTQEEWIQRRYAKQRAFAFAAIDKNNPREGRDERFKRFCIKMRQAMWARYAVCPWPPPAWLVYSESEVETGNRRDYVNKLRELRQWGVQLKQKDAKMCAIAEERDYQKNGGK